MVADCAYGDNDDYRAELRRFGLAYVLALNRRAGSWALAYVNPTPVDAARVLAWCGPDDPAGWTRVERRFCDGRHETWWAADASLDHGAPTSPTAW
ncbi:hypothetical protein GCM10010517_56740 [Streptosporangium fragile]|uniref:Transposase IS701-like DDE domain-containing protein n=1 Tax=Streptosporangium fragile TaxID=46186 RepID=A0ABP6IME5_9ACTN